ncbi:MAG: hypothetical protein RMJ85_14580, partial [Anaerolineales bacterium]|nr:hypothetical protein [Anaerolineales bacterium]
EDMKKNSKDILMWQLVLPARRFGAKLYTLRQNPQAFGGISGICYTVSGDSAERPGFRRMLFRPYAHSAHFLNCSAGEKHASLS